MAKWEIHTNPILGRFAIDKETNFIKFEDGTVYTPAEVKLLNRCGKTTPPQVHFIKHIFDGTIISAPKGK